MIWSASQHIKSSFVLAEKVSNESIEVKRISLLFLYFRAAAAARKRALVRRTATGVTSGSHLGAAALVLRAGDVDRAVATADTFAVDSGRRNVMRCWQPTRAGETATTATAAAGCAHFLTGDAFFFVCFAGEHLFFAGDFLAGDFLAGEHFFAGEAAFFFLAGEAFFAGEHLRDFFAAAGDDNGEFPLCTAARNSARPTPPFTAPSAPSAISQPTPTSQSQWRERLHADFRLPEHGFAGPTVSPSTECFLSVQPTTISSPALPEIK
jgi:hypothetical protein